MLRKTFVAIVATLCTTVPIFCQTERMAFGKGILQLTPLTENAVRIQYTEGEQTDEALPDWIYVQKDGVKWKNLRTRKMSVAVDADRQTISVKNAEGKTVFTATELRLGTTNGNANREAMLRFASPSDEYLYGLGQFQDGYNNIRGLSRRLTQVNTQISIPMIISNMGYGLLWNNYGLTEMNPSSESVAMTAAGEAAGSETVDVTTTEGNRREVRRKNVFTASIDIPESGFYSLLLDVGQKMARRHNLVIDGETVIEMNNLWLPPTTSRIVKLEKGRHSLSAELSGGDHPTLFYHKVGNETVLRSPIANSVDATVFVGSADEVVAAYRTVTGEAPLMPRWALGYIHCRERFHSQDEILQTANRFRSEQLPVDMLVQDWQYWGRHGWNSMQFDENNYPNPKTMTDSLHAMKLRLMLSVWSKIDKRSDVGRQMEHDGYYIPGTDWIDFFNPDAARSYWQNFSQRLVPLGIDAWWQDATEPENDDLVGRRVNNGKWAGETFRNVYPLLVNKTVYEGLMNDRPTSRPMILTRCGFPGIQRYGSALWSGDVGNDWETFRRQITAGLGMQAAGIPWWTYDAGGFFRPNGQYTDKAYIERMLRWIETAIYLPLMRVHGYMSDTEPWRYGKEAQTIIAQCLHERYRLLPYTYSNAADVAFNGATLMRPLVFDFPNDSEALSQNHEYMFGRAMLISPVTEPGVSQWHTYLPQTTGGWYEYRSGKHLDGGQTVSTAIDHSFIPVFVRAGSIIPTASEAQNTKDGQACSIINIYPGEDAVFTLYEDDGETNDYLDGKCCRIPITWNNGRQRLTVGKREGAYEGMLKERTFTLRLPDGKTRTIAYQGKEVSISFTK